MGIFISILTMSLRQTKIDHIYKVIADKEESFLCKIFSKWIWEITLVQMQWWGLKRSGNGYIRRRLPWRNYSVIWKPVMLGDVLDWIDKNIVVHPRYRTLVSNQDKVLDKREYKRLAIESQSDECIAFIYSLVKDEWWLSTDDSWWLG